jgi:hypothetical protein
MTRRHECGFAATCFLASAALAGENLRALEPPPRFPLCLLSGDHFIEDLRRDT